MKTYKLTKQSQHSWGHTKRKNKQGVQKGAGGRHKLVQSHPQSTSVTHISIKIVTNSHSPHNKPSPIIPFHLTINT